MKVLIGVVVLMVLGLWLVTAQTTTRTPTAISALPDTTSSAPAVSVAVNADERPPLKGANSFTETQVKDRIEAAGYTQVGALLKDQDGIWRATAMKGGVAVRIALDFKGNIVAS